MNVLLPPESGFLPVVDCNGWRVAFLRRCATCADAATARLERHMETDEVFFLLEGSCTLFSGPDRTPTVLRRGPAYRVPAREWHALALSEDALLAIVESTDTTRSNSEYVPMQTGPAGVRGSGA